MCAVWDSGLHGKGQRVKAPSECSKWVVNSVSLSRNLPVFLGFFEIIRVVLLNIDEVEKYFDDYTEDYVAYEERGAVTTTYARSQGAWFYDEKDEYENKGCWWLRYLGKDYEKAEGKYDYISCVNFDAYIERAAQGVEEMCGIRPAFWLRRNWTA